jgi:hypothetical protein
MGAVPQAKLQEISAALLAYRKPREGSEHNTERYNLVYRSMDLCTDIRHDFLFDPSHDLVMDGMPDDVKIALREAMVDLYAAQTHFFNALDGLARLKEGPKIGGEPAKNI